MSGISKATSTGQTLYARVQHRYANGNQFALDAEIVLNAGITVLFGASGSGKSTLLGCLAGLVTPVAGRIAMEERVLFDSEQRINVPTQQRGLGYLFQNLALFPHMTVLQNVEYGTQRLGKRERKERCDSVLEAFRIAQLADRRPADISGGERQRVALARALVTNPAYLLLDEPLSALDARTKSRIIADLRRWNESHRIPILFVTHDREEVYALAERVVAMEQGKIIADGTPHEVLDRPTRESMAQIAGFENVFGATVVARHNDLGTMTCKILPPIADASSALEKVFAADEGIRVEAPLTKAGEGSAVKLAVRAGDILVAVEEPRGLSARNLLKATIEGIEQRGTMFVLKAVCGRDARLRVAFEVHVTPGAVGSLGLQQGGAVWLVIKTHSVHVVSGLDRAD